MIDVQNVIYTGVAGTGKTYRLLELAKQYTQTFDPVNQSQILTMLVEDLRWCDVVCLVFIEQQRQGQELLKVAEIVAHDFFQAKAKINQIKNHSHYVRSVLRDYSSPDSATVNNKQRASQAYFDKDDSGSWYLLKSAVPLLSDLDNQLNDYHNAQPLEQSIERFSMVSFHQSYGYDEFVEGIRPQIDQQTGQMRYCIEQGAFLKLCQRAEKDPNNRYAMLIDEINRANVMQVFGELMSLIEPSKRIGQSAQMYVRLAYSGKQCAIPSNIDIFATMNTQDQSLIIVDSAFRRRFEFVEMLPNSEGLAKLTDDNNHIIDLAKLLTGLNRRICQQLGKQYQLGQAYFYHVCTLHDLLTVMARQILPQLIHDATYVSHQPHALKEILQLEHTHWLIADQQSYQINSQILWLTHHNATELESEFFSVTAFETLY